MKPRDAATGFEIESQRGENISNVGGDQKIYYGSRGSQTAKLIAVLGLSLSLAGLALLVSVGVMTTRNVLEDVNGAGVETPYTDYLAPGWHVAVALLAAGIVVKAYGRVLAGR